MFEIDFKMVKNISECLKLHSSLIKFKKKSLKKIKVFLVK